MDSLSSWLNRGFVLGLGCGAGFVWLLTWKARKTLRSPNSSVTGPEIEEEMSDDDEEKKLVVVVRTDLKMGKGKIAAQVAHAAVAAYKQAKRWNPEVLGEWERCGQTKVALKASGGEEQLRQLATAARAHGLGVALIRDAGRTQIASGSTTVLGVGPGPCATIDKVTGHLSLL
ncbi:peptidyl-tRNA hydrolase 2, mitochondrial-like [Neocloeon triangulifer]|uniref:peptidyl-tRNA hydrolase 2, mitochondrial-like n=1 Tax=Neocloeon triangulifer TaxID=2078957 RepID=UPI00286F580A|nr:peptidyl-tRNA hydrolase 2, mitochondrial-like [Neocloeon triangulifer]